MPELTIRPSRPGPQLRLGLGAVALTGVLWLAFLGFWVFADEPPPWYTVIFLLQIPLWLSQANSEVRWVVLSPDGITWRTLLQTARRPWSDFSDVGVMRPPFGSGLGDVVARLRPGAPSPSWRSPFPSVFARSGRDDAEELVLLASLTPGEAKRPTWDRPDEDVVAAFREHAGDRWVEDI